MSNPIVLLVDSDASLHTTIQKELPDNCGFLGVRRAELVMRFARNRPPALVIVSDNVSLPPEAIVQQLRAEWPPIRAIILAADPSPQAMRAWAKLGPVLRKPVDGVRLREEVTRLTRLQDMSETIERMRSDTGAPLSTGARSASGPESPRSLTGRHQTIPDDSPRPFRPDTGRR